MRFILGAYTTCPSLNDKDSPLKDAYWEKIKTLPFLGGIEFPFWGDFAISQEPWVWKNWNNDWNIVLTTIPGVMRSLETQPKFGLASMDEDGRHSAIKFMEKVRQTVHDLNNHVGRKAVIAVALASAPRRSIQRTESSANALKQSLEKIASWNWDGASLVIEHCDAQIPDHLPEKGFLTLEEETQAVRHSGTPVGISVNWGRSVLEHRHVDGAIQHIEYARQHGLLQGLMFSGCTDKESPYGIWKDSHMPPPQEGNRDYFADHSLMSAKEIKRAFSACGKESLIYAGLKITSRPYQNNSIVRPVGLINDSLSLLHECFNQFNQIH
ncbi:MAG: DUF4862 family protein [SAR324 cluster bacterium]|nr:DUF4862 family protein [SAR324 cluster bacterium]